MNGKQKANVFEILNDWDERGWVEARPNPRRLAETLARSTGWPATVCRMGVDAWLA